MASKKDESVNARFLDAKDEPNQRLLPVRGYEKGPLLTLIETVQPLAELLDDLDIMVDTALDNSRKPTDGLTVNESAAIHLYTMQWEEPNVSLYTQLNSILRSERRESLRLWFPYLKLVLTALFKLPSLRSTVWRGVRGNLSDQYDDDHVWWGFSSCTENIQTMEEFVGKSGVRTLFNIECINGKAIRAHSFYKKESEILLMPGTYLRVVGKWSPTKDLYMIHLREATPPRVFLEPPFKSSSIASTPSSAETPAIENLKISKEKDPSSVPTKPKQPKGKELCFIFSALFLKETRSELFGTTEVKQTEPRLLSISKFKKMLVFS